MRALRRHKMADRAPGGNKPRDSQSNLLRREIESVVARGPTPEEVRALRERQRREMIEKRNAELKAMYQKEAQA